MFSFNDDIIDYLSGDDEDRFEGYLPHVKDFVIFF